MAVTLTWYGHSTFGLESDGKQVVIDPFFTGNPVCPISAGDVSPSTILITHAHNDHVGDAVAIAKRTLATVICIVELADVLEKQGVTTTIGANHGGTVLFDGGSVKIVPAWHSSSLTLEDGSTIAPGVPSGHIVRFGGQTIYFAGDTALFSDMQLIGEEELDVAVIPIGDHFTMGPKDAIRAVKFLNPKAVIPCHYNTFPPIQQDAHAWAEQVEAQTNATAIVLDPGESVEID